MSPFHSQLITLVIKLPMAEFENNTSLCMKQAKCKILCVIAGTEFSPLNETLTFPADTTELTRCIDVELFLDGAAEPLMLLNDIFAATAMFQGNSVAVMLGQVLATDTASSGMSILENHHAVAMC